MDDVGVGLDEARQLVDVLAVEAVLGVDRHVGARHLAVERGQVPLAGAVSDGRDRIVLLDLLRRDLDGFELLGRIVDLQNGHIACGVVPDDRRRVLGSTVRIGDLDFARAVHDMVVGQHDPRFVDDHPGSGAFAVVETRVDQHDAWSRFDRFALLHRGVLPRGLLRVRSVGR